MSPALADQALVLPAPAKLNLMLHILGRRGDGYHNLQTLIQFIDHGDTLAFARRDDGQLHLHDPQTGVAVESNLIMRSARLLQDYSGCRLGADIWLQKRLPMGAGLGGGSSDAATTLLGLNRLWKLEISNQTLAELGLQLGADVPVFVNGQAAFVEGIGEQLQPVQLPEPWFLVVAPSVSISTAQVFNAPELTRNTPASTVRAVISGGGHNDCQAVVAKRYPEVRNALSWLAVYTDARLTGSGGCVFGSFANKAEADKVAQRLPATLPGFVAKGCNLSPLHQRLQQLRDSSSTFRQ